MAALADFIVYSAFIELVRCLIKKNQDIITKLDTEQVIVKRTSDIEFGQITENKDGRCERLYCQISTFQILRLSKLKNYLDRITKLDI